MQVPAYPAEKLSVQRQDIPWKDVGTNTNKLCRFKFLLPGPPEEAVFRRNCLISLVRRTGC